MEEIKYYEYSIVTKPLKNYRFKMAEAPSSTQEEDNKEINQSNIAYVEDVKEENIAKDIFIDEIPAVIAEAEIIEKPEIAAEKTDDVLTEMVEAVDKETNDTTEKKEDYEEKVSEEFSMEGAVHNEEPAEIEDSELSKPVNIETTADTPVEKEKKGLLKKKKEKTEKKEKNTEDGLKSKKEKKSSFVQKKKKDIQNDEASEKRKAKKEKFQKSEKVKKPKFSLFEDVYIEETLEEKVAKLINDDGYYNVILPEDEGHQVTRKSTEDKTKLYLILGLGSVSLIALSYIVIEVVNML